MHLLAPIASGMAGAAGGTVEVYARGTSTPITLYTDFEGTVTTSNPASLDANGRAKLYVDQYARCVVKDDGGATVIDFVDGKDANAVELRIASIVGNAYVGGAAAAGNPISVEAAFNKLVTSFGSTDFNVLLASASLTLQSALGALWRARVFDVKQYGALGDGATNDLNAINAAASAANTAGGGVVFFPAGTYNISAGLTMFSTVEYVGVGGSLSVIRATSDFVVFSGPTMSRATRRLKLDKATAMTLWVSASAGSGDSTFEDCEFAVTTGASPAAGHFQLNATSKLTFRRCTMSGGAPSESIIFAVYANGELLLDECSVAHVNEGRLAVLLGDAGGHAKMTMVNTTVDYASSSSGVHNRGVEVQDYAILRMSHCRFIADDNKTEQNAIYVSGTTECHVFEDCNDFSSHYSQVLTTSTHGPYGGSALAAGVHRGTREVSALAALNMNGTPITALLYQAKTCVIRTTGGAGTRVINADAVSGNGEHAVMAVHNDTGSSITYQWGAFMASSGSTFAVAANSVRVFGLVFVAERAEWFIVSDTAGAETAE